MHKLRQLLARHTFQQQAHHICVHSGIHKASWGSVSDVETKEARDDRPQQLFDEGGDVGEVLAVGELWEAVAPDDAVELFLGARLRLGV